MTKLERAEILMREGLLGKPMVKYVMIFKRYQFFLKSEKVSKAVSRTAVEMGISKRAVYRAIKRLRG